MRTITILLSLLACTCLLQAQETSRDSLSRKEIRKKHKEEKELLRQKQYAEISALLENHSFVLEAENVQDQWQNCASGGPLINFVMVDSITMIAQYGFINHSGDNGAGGGTGKGEITTYKLSKNDKARSFSLEMGVDMRGGRVNVFMNVDASGTAKADVVFPIYGHLFYDGQIVPLKDSRVHVGRYL